MWLFLASLCKPNTNYYKITTEAIFAKHFLKWLQLWSRGCSTHDEPEPSKGVDALPNKTKLNGLFTLCYEKTNNRVYF